MVEQSESGFNKKLLVLALVVGAVAVALLVVRDHYKEQAARGNVIEVYAWKRDVKAGEPVSIQDVTLVPVPKDSTTVLHSVLRRGQEQLLDANASRSVVKGDLVNLTDLMQGSRTSPAARISMGMRAITLAVDPNRTPGKLLQIGGRADLVGMVSIKGQPPKSHPLIQNLKVLAVGGDSGPDDDSIGSERSRSSSDPTMRVYRSITVEVSPKIAVELADLLPRIYEGRLWLLVRNPVDSQVDFEGINPDVRPALTAPLPERGLGSSL